MAAAETAGQGFSMRFWGVRGSIACPGADTVRYGGNTTCIEVRCGDRVLIFDGGTGLRPLGNKLAAEGHARLDLFFTHTHLDHLGGVPFFKPAYIPGIELHFWAGHLGGERKLQQVLSDMMMAPLFPVPLTVFNACAYHDFTAGQTVHLDGGITLDTIPLNHPNGCCGYRIAYQGKIAAIITDYEHVSDTPEPALVEFVCGADILVFDATYTSDEYPRYVGWGHSTPEHGVALAEAAGAKRLVLFHHDPSHTDGLMDEIVAAADRVRPGTIAAIEGQVLRP